MRSGEHFDLWPYLVHQACSDPTSTSKGPPLWVCPCLLRKNSFRSGVKSFLASPGLSLTAVLVRVNAYLSSLLHVRPSFVRDSCDLGVIARRSNVTPIFSFDGTRVTYTRTSWSFSSFVLPRLEPSFLGSAGSWLSSPARKPNHRAVRVNLFFRCLARPRPFHRNPRLIEAPCSR